MNRKFTVGRRARVDENIPHNYQIVDLNTYQSSKPIVLVLVILFSLLFNLLYNSSSL